MRQNEGAADLLSFDDRYPYSIHPPEHPKLDEHPEVRLGRFDAKNVIMQVQRIDITTVDPLNLVLLAKTPKVKILWALWTAMLIAGTIGFISVLVNSYNQRKTSSSITVSER